MISIMVLYGRTQQRSGMNGIWRGTRPLARAATLFTAVLIAGAWGLTQDDRGSYRHLTSDARRLVDQLPGVGNMNGQADDAHSYNALEESQRTAFEAIVHALENEELLEILDRITKIWGEKPGESDGRHQFRVSVELASDAHDDLRRAGFVLRRDGHVKKSNGTLVDRAGADSFRQPAGHPSIQVSWLQENPQIGEVDIDYISPNFAAAILSMFGIKLGHFNPKNSDVRADLFGHPFNYEKHVERYGYLALWWETER